MTSSPDFREQEFERLMAKALVVYVHDKIPTDQDIQTYAKALWDSDSQYAFDDVLKMAAVAMGHDTNVVYALFQDPKDEEKAAKLYNEIFIEPAVLEAKKRDFGGLKFVKSPNRKSYALRTEGVHFQGSMGAARSRDLVSIDEVEKYLTGSVLNPQPAESSRPAFFRICNNAANPTEADAFFGKYCDIAKDKLIYREFAINWDEVSAHVKALGREL